MAISEFDDTVPTSTANTPVEPGSAPPKQKRPSWRRITLIGILSLLLVAVISALIGYSSGIAQRKDAEAALVGQQASQQFELAQQDIDIQQYSRARQRLEYIAQIDPNYPGLTAKLAEVIMRMNATATPLPVPTPTVLPTVDTRGVEGIFSQAQQYYFNGEWSSAIDTLLILRKTDPNYRAVDVDGMLFIALRNRGIDKILKETDLEGGLYELTQAALFGPLDSEAQGYINWVSLYITGASFWELDWVKVVEYFSQVGPAVPGLRDRSGMTATERWRLGLFNLGKHTLSEGDACTAAEHFQASLDVGPDPEVEQALLEANQMCIQASSEPQISEPTAVIPTAATPTAETPTATTPPVIEETPSPPVIVETPTP